jgi:hypothetical protein
MFSTKSTRRIRLMVGLLAVVALMVAPAHAGSQTYNPCGEQSNPGGGHESGGGLCAYGPAGCVAIGLRIDVFPNAALPGGANVELSRTQANAGSFAPPTGGYAYGQGHGDAHQAQATVPPTLGTGIIESRCDAWSTAMGGKSYNDASGTAETYRLSLSLFGYSIPVLINADVLREDGWSSGGAGGNSANVVTVTGWVGSGPLTPISYSAAPNTAVSLGALGTLWLNEQIYTPPSLFNPCPTFSGDALRLVVNNPATGAPAAQVLVSWVSTSTCP